MRGRQSAEKKLAISELDVDGEEVSTDVGYSSASGGEASSCEGGHPRRQAVARPRFHSSLDTIPGTPSAGRHPPQSTADVRGTTAPHEALEVYGKIRATTGSRRTVPVSQSTGPDQRSAVGATRLPPGLLAQDSGSSRTKARECGAIVKPVSNEVRVCRDTKITRPAVPALLSTTPDQGSAVGAMQPPPGLPARYSGLSQAKAHKFGAIGVVAQAKMVGEPLKLPLPPEVLQAMLAFPPLDAALPAKKRLLPCTDLSFEEAALKALDPKRPVKVRMSALLLDTETIFTDFSDFLGREREGGGPYGILPDTRGSSPGLSLCQGSPPRTSRRSRESGKEKGPGGPRY